MIQDFSGCIEFQDAMNGNVFVDLTGEISNLNSGVAVGDFVRVTGEYAPDPITLCDGDPFGAFTLVDSVGICTIGTPFCFGVGRSSPCPRGNDTPAFSGRGCENSTGEGALLFAELDVDHLGFHMSDGLPNQPSLLVQGATRISTPFEDGILCLGTPTERIEGIPLDADGAGVSTLNIVEEGNVTPGVTRSYQQWDRDPGGVSPCGTGSTPRTACGSTSRTSRSPESFRPHP